MFARESRPACLGAHRLSLVIIVVLSASAGCVGPRSLELTRLRYDQAVNDTNEQQWLRNIVRLRYGDLPSLLDVAAITSQFEVSGQGNFTGGLERASANKSYFGNFGLQFRDSPTLSYTPRDPGELARLMVAPVGVTALGLMARTGWSISDVLRLVVADANGLENAPGAEQILPATVPKPTPFNQMASIAELLLIERVMALADFDTPDVVSTPISADRISGADMVLAANNKLQFRPAGAKNLVLTRSDRGYKLVLSSTAVALPEVGNLRTLLRLSKIQSEYNIDRIDRIPVEELEPLADSKDSLSIRTRTLLEMLIFVSKGVHVPEDHAQRGLAAQTVGPDGRVFDWPVVTEGLFHVCAQKKRPKSAAIAVEYRGYWFYIADNDKRSMSTLMLIQEIFNLQLTEPKKAGPVLTLPVGN